MEKKYLRAEEGQPIIDGMIEDAARKLSDLTGSDFPECYDDIADYVNGFDWMLLEEDEEGNDVIDVNYFSVFLERAINFCVSMND